MPRSDGLFGGFRRLFTFGRRTRTSGGAHERGPISHVIIIDGTLSSLDEGCESNAGLTYNLCTEAASTHNMIVRYEAGIQWRSWRDTMSVIEGRGINEQIQRLYGSLASRFRPGDKLFFFGYSRGAFAIRSLSGFIDLMGLLRAEDATERNIRDAYRHYQTDPHSRAAKLFRQAHCHDTCEIEMIGVWDTVAALGLHFPILWRYSTVFHELHDFYPAKCAKRAYHALAYHERREAYQPVLWDTNPNAKGQILQQMWFRGTHSDVGGQLSIHAHDRKLANVSLVWMLDKAEDAGLPLPVGWRSRFLADPYAKSLGMNRDWGKFFVLRQDRIVGEDPSEVLHPAIKAAHGH